MALEAIVTAASTVPKALGRAFRWKRLLDEGTYPLVSDIARVETLDRTYVGDVLRLTLLAPEIEETLVADRQTFPHPSRPTVLRPWSSERAGNPVTRQREGSAIAIQYHSRLAAG